MQPVDGVAEVAGHGVGGSDGVSAALDLDGALLLVAAKDSLRPVHSRQITLRYCGSTHSQRT